MYSKINIEQAYKINVEAEYKVPSEVSIYSKFCTDTNVHANMHAQLQPCALSLCTLWFGQWVSPTARASSIDTGLASFSAWPSACPIQTRLHAGGVSVMDCWTAAQTWKTQTKKEEVQDEHVVPPPFSI